MVNAGKVSYWIGRAAVQSNKFIVPFNTLMILYLAAEKQPLFWLAIQLGLCVLSVLIWVDHNKVIEKELSYWFDRNPRFVKMESDIEEIKVMMRHE